MRYGEQIFEIQVPLDGVELGSSGLMTEIVERFHSMVNPLRPISARATQIHGYTDADVAGT